MFGKVMTLSVLDPVSTSRMFGDKLSQVVYFSLNVPVVLIIVP